MVDPIRMLHFADSHIGMENYGKIDPNTGTSSRVRDFLDRLDEVVDYAIDHGADLAVFAGDAFKDRSPDPTQQREFAQRIKRLADAMPTLLLVGNHDMPGMMVKANSLDIFRALDVPGVIVGYKDDAQVVQTAHGPVLLAWMPYPMRNRLMAWKKYQGKSIEELNQGLRSEVAKRIAVLTEEAAAQDMPRVFVGHFTVEAAKFGSERSVMLGGDLPILKSMVADPVWDYVALGDFEVSRLVSYVDPYAAHIEDDLGVKVRLEKRWGVEGMTSGQLLLRLRSSQMLRDHISEAEVVTLVIGFNDVGLQLIGPYKRGDCGGEDNRDCIRDALESFRVNYDAIIAELFTLCSSKTIIRTMTNYYGNLRYWSFKEDLRPFIEPLNDHTVQAASENNIPVALAHLAFNGPDGDEDPADKGYLASDGVHASELGAAVIADLHQELGYEYTCP